LKQATIYPNSTIKQDTWQDFMVPFRAIGFDHWQSCMWTGESGIVTCYCSKNRRVHVRRHTSTLPV